MAIIKIAKFVSGLVTGIIAFEYYGLAHTHTLSPVGGLGLLLKMRLSRNKAALLYVSVVSVTLIILRLTDSNANGCKDHEVIDNSQTDRREVEEIRVDRVGLGNKLVPKESRKLSTSSLIESGDEYDSDIDSDMEMFDCIGSHEKIDYEDQIIELINPNELENENKIILADIEPDIYAYADIEDYIESFEEDNIMKSLEIMIETEFSTEESSDELTIVTKNDQLIELISSHGDAEYAFSRTINSYSRKSVKMLLRAGSFNRMIAFPENPVNDVLVHN